MAEMGLRDAKEWSGGNLKWLVHPRNRPCPRELTVGEDEDEGEDDPE